MFLVWMFKLELSAETANTSLSWTGGKYRPISSKVSLFSSLCIMWVMCAKWICCYSDRTLRAIMQPTIIAMSTASPKIPPRTPKIIASNGDALNYWARACSTTV